MTANAALRRTPAIWTVAWPKSNWASPGGCESGTKTSCACRFDEATASFTWVIPPE